MTINEIQILSVMRDCYMTRDEAIRFLEREMRSRMEYETYLNGQLDPRD